MRILAIETSCDESAVAVLDEQRGLLSHELWSQIDLHRAFGGVVPELASRDHLRRLLPLLRTALDAAGTRAAEIEGVAYTAGPGLVGALLTGAALARSLSFGWQVPAIGIHHLEGHLLAPMLEDPTPPFPHIALLVSGGHTMLIEVRAIGDYRVLGQTRDDAAGEAFDKTAKLLGLPYPGGPELAQLAGRGHSGRYSFPRPMLDRPGFEFSFSGLKTAVARYVESHPDTATADIAAGFQESVADVLTMKAVRAATEVGVSTLLIAGGVAANSRLRELAAELCAAAGLTLRIPGPRLCTDNGAMIASFAAHLVAAGASPSPLDVASDPGLPVVKGQVS